MMANSDVREIPIPPGTKPARDASAAKGPKNAPVIFMEVSDFQCPVCKRAHEGLAALATDYPDKVRFVFKQNPLAMHKNALNAAAAALAAGRQGRFWEFADMAFADQRALSENDLMENARKLKLDMARFKKDYEDPALRLRAKTEGEVATALGATGTPSFFVNGKQQVGWASYGAIRQQIDNEIRAVEALQATGLSLKQARDARVKENCTESEKFLNSPLGIEFSEQ
jgi:protein-disulfide isomerase